MGGNNSRLHGSGGEVLPAKIRQRIGELRNRKMSGATLLAEEEEESTFSKKQLLNHDGVVDDGNKSQSSEENESDGDNNNKGSPNYTSHRAKRVENLSKVVPLPEPGTEEQRNELHSYHEQEKGTDVEKKSKIELKTERVKSARVQPEIKHGNSDEDAEEEEEDEIESGRLICPGSPSFKIYCNEDEKKKEKELPESNNEELLEFKPRGENQTNAILQKSYSANSVESSASVSGNPVNSDEMVEIESAPKRKGNKKKKFGVAKNLLHVKHIHMNRMNPILACTCSERRRLLTDQ